MTFEEWLGLVARSPNWNGMIRTPRAWRTLYNAGLTPEQAAVSNKREFHIIT